MPAAGARKAAAERGDTRYFGGKPCQVGHTGPRITHTGKCLECETERSTIRNATNQEYRRAYNASRTSLKREYNKNFYANRKDEIIAKVSAYQKKRTREDPIFALRRTARSRIQKAVMRFGVRKCAKTMSILGCDPATLRRHLEMQFLPKMSWDNRQAWHVDHIVPLSSARTEDEILKLCHYTNLRPLWAKDNLSKGDSIQFLI